MTQMMEGDDMKIAAAYIRVSTDDQLEYSPDSQLKAVREYAKRNGYILPDEYIYREEEGVSGRKAASRPEFQRMIGTAKTKPRPFEAIIVWKFSRFARNRQDSIVYKSMLRKQCGIDVVSVTEPLGDDKMSVLIEALIEAMDEYYSINLAEEVKRGMTEKVKRGEPVTAPAFGYRIEHKQYYPDPDTAPIVQKIFEDFAAGAGYRDLADKLNQMGVRTKRGGKWENRTIAYLLNNPVYIGKVRWSPAGRISRDYSRDDTLIVDGTHEPIVSKELWDTCHSRMEDISRLYPRYSRQQKKDDYLLHGLVRCSNCGATLVRTTTGSLQCHMYAKGACRVSHSITIEKLTATLIEAMEKDSLASDPKIEIVSASRGPSEATTIRQQIDREKRKLERIKEAYMAGIDTLDEYRKNKEAITAVVEALERRAEQKAPPMPTMEEIQAKIREALDVVKDPSASTLSKNEYLRSIIDRVIFDRRKSTIKIVYKF